MMIPFLKNRWFLLANFCVINLFLGSILAWSVFAGPKAAQLSLWTGQQISEANLFIVFSLANALAPLPMILGGYFNDKYGPSCILIPSSFLIGLGLYFSGCAASLLELVLSYSICFGLGLGFSYGATINSAIKLFPDHRGLAGGLATTFYGMCSVAVPPLAGYLIEHFGIEKTFEILGSVIGIVILIGGLLSLRFPINQPLIQLSNPCRDASSPVLPNMNWKQMIKTSYFWMMLLLLLCSAVTGMMILSHGADIAIKQFDLSFNSATKAVAFIALVNTIGRLAGGTISDKIGILNTLFLSNLLSIIGALLLAFSCAPSTLSFYSGLSLIGVSFGAFMGIYPGFTAKIFGTKHNSSNYGVMFCGFSLAGIIGPALMNYIVLPDAPFAPYIFASLSALLGSILCIALRKKLLRILQPYSHFKS